ncbi:hypothetical protein [Micromonospora mirobrigensis]|uniref:Uncharacterized protein n=1 Tax=Micromonospora mirobrigensis TaxID=262898 RepID=A0A1C4WTN0_9ACTN|nr:hypothetical protein [Micromonospora mirobrigensis]SCE99231.1 hypothetical protein GA0070564_102482 [Micromonospora mirobrigensis]
MNAFDLSPAQVRNRLILLARRAAPAAGPRPQPWVRPHGPVEVVPAVAVTRVPVIPRVSVVPGDVVRLAESDYRYSAGPLRLRIVRVRLDLSEWYDGQWVWLEGVEIGPDNQDGAFRQVLARAAALPGPEECQQEAPGFVNRASP